MRRFADVDRWARPGPGADRTCAVAGPPASSLPLRWRTGPPRPRPFPPLTTKDIRPKGFQAIEIEGFVSGDALETTRRVLDDGEARNRLVEHSYAVAKRHYSYRILHRRLTALMTAYQEALGLDGGGYITGVADPPAGGGLR